MYVPGSLECPGRRQGHLRGLSHPNRFRSRFHLAYGRCGESLRGEVVCGRTQKWLLLSSEIAPGSYDPSSVIVIDKRNRGRTTPSSSQPARPDRCPKSSRPNSGIDTMPSYEKPSSTANIMLSSMSDKRSCIVVVASRGGSEGQSRSSTRWRSRHSVYI